MERLTNKAWRNFDPWECCGQDKYCQRGCHDPGGCTKGCIVPRLYARLGAYEDTELTPEEINDLASAREISPEAEYAINKHADSIIERLDKLLTQTDDDARLRELAEADKDGRLAVLPFTSGRTLLCIDKDSTDFLFKDEGLSVYKQAAEEKCGLCVVMKDDELHGYLGYCQGYGWHISDLHIYDTPRELSEFRRATDPCDSCHAEYTWECTDCKKFGGDIKRPPQSWCYVEEN